MRNSILHRILFLFLYLKKRTMKKFFIVNRAQKIFDENFAQGNYQQIE